MSNAARKARKKAGIQFSKPAKVGTPPHVREIPQVFKRGGFGRVLGMWPSNRAQAKIARRYGAATQLAPSDYIAVPRTTAPTSPLV